MRLSRMYVDVEVHWLVHRTRMYVDVEVQWLVRLSRMYVNVELNKGLHGAIKQETEISVAFQQYSMYVDVEVQ